MRRKDIDFFNGETQKKHRQTYRETDRMRRKDIDVVNGETQKDTDKHTERQTE